MVRRSVASLLALALSVVLFAALALGCGGGTRSMRRCPDSPQVPCMVGEECSIDEEHDCERCRCAEGFGVPEHQVDPVPPPSPE